MSSIGSKFWTAGSVPLIEPEFLGSIVSAASDIAIVVSRTGTVLSVLVNEQQPSYGKLDHWEGRPIHDFLTPESLPKLDRVLESYAAGLAFRQSVELNHRDNAEWQFPIRYSFHSIGQEGALLMLGRDLRLIAETQQQLVQVQVALERGYETRREFDARYRTLMASINDPVVFVTVSEGRIRDLNGLAAALLGASRDDLLGAAFAQEFKDRRRGEFVESLLNLAIADSPSGISVQTARTRKRVSIHPGVFRAGGERMLLCRLETEDGTQVVPDQFGQNLMAMFEKGPDAMVFTTVKGVIENANDAFLDLAGATYSSDVRGRSLADFLARGQIDLGVLLENAVRSGQMRLYSTRLTNELGTVLPIEVSATYLNRHTSPSVAFVIRDAGRLEALRSAPAPGEDGAPSYNVAELVGSATLKEIVAETADVVEKICIETAVELTRNNRVAAAEMLGLSRQSLYVKLRKHDLLSRDGQD